MIEVPKVLVSGDNRAPSDFDLVKTIESTNTQRFLTPTIKELTSQLEEAEYQVKVSIMPFICSIFGIFHQKRKVWSQMISCLAEIDCYCSLATVSSNVSIIFTLIIYSLNLQCHDRSF